MRNALAVVGLFVFMTACGGSSKPGTSTGGGTGTGTGTGGEATTGGTTGGTAGTLPSGATCSSNASCESGICGIGGAGNCCTLACNVSNAVCGATACDNSGNCVYADAGGTCAPSTCSGDMLTLQQCDGFGNCFINPAKACPNNYACSSDRADCNTTCTASTDCAVGFYCSSGTCLAQSVTGSCTENGACTSGVCGLNGTGNCCAAACTNNAAPCGATGCDAADGGCVYPDTTVLCGPGGTETCTDGVQNDPNVHCDGDGYCPAEMTDCSPFICGAAACFSTCTDDTSCIAGTAYCDQDGGVCLNKVFNGPCLSDDACLSGMCGIAGSGNCCQQACAPTAPPCGATGCDPTVGACTFPDKTTLCGSIAESCTGDIQQNASACDGTGNCNNNPGTTPCTPFICGTNACLATCTDDTSCVSGDVCDTANASCCMALAAGGAITVDGAAGQDTTACCGYGAAAACKTVSHAMALIDASQAKNVTINASLTGVGGDWPAGETYPIKLGWGAELSAPGVYFLDRNGANKEIIDVAQYSANDTIGYASIVGGAANQVGIGLSAAHNNQLTDSAGVRIEASQTLYIANALLNSSAIGTSTAIVVAAGASLVLGEDQPAAILGTVTIGNSDNKFFGDGWDGIDCETANSQGCTITDAPLSGQSSVIIQGQQDADISALDFASITLTSAPVIGLSPGDGGFDECPTSTLSTAGSASGKPDVASSRGAAVVLQGQATMTFENGTVQCISGAGFELMQSLNKDGNPTLTLATTTIQNTEQAVYVSAGTATISGSTIQFNYNGVKQTSDGTNVGTVDLSGAGTDAGVNTVVCSDGMESINAVNGSTTIPGINVLNDTTATLNASDVAWDTSGPDLFSCDAATLATCTCEISSCTNGGGMQDMDAVYDSTGTITTTNGTVSPIATANGCN